MINWRLQKFLLENDRTLLYQSGYRPSRSTIDALARLEADIRTTMIRDDYCLVIFIVITQAFDKVWHHGLVSKLASVGLTGHLPCFIQQFLQNRSIQVKIDGVYSRMHPLHAGTPQGAVLSPTIFNMMINDIFNGCPDEIQYSLYADNGAMRIVGQDETTCADVMQKALLSLEKWAHTRGLPISASKIVAMKFSRKHKLSCPELSINTTVIRYVTSHKYLGMTLDRKLTWSKHILVLRERYQRDLRLMAVVSRRGFGADYLSLRRIYIALI